MEKNYCENCGYIQNLACYENAKPPNEGITLCEECSWLTPKQINRQNFGEHKIVLRDLESA